MKVLLISSECAPYYSTGGLADVVYGLANELANRLHDARILVPRYRLASTQLPNLEPVVTGLRVDLGSSHAEGDELGAYSRNANILKSPGKPTIYFVEQEYYFGRDNLYGYPDDYERFIFFGLTALKMLSDEAFRRMEGEWFPEIIQGYDWATGLMPGWLRHHAKSEQRFNAVRFVLGIHNPRRMGIFGSRSLQLARQDAGGIYQEIGEQDERVNFLGRGILFADKIVTVNPHFDDPEVPGETPLTAGFGASRRGSRNPLPEPARVLKPALTQRLREGDLVGIRNGIDEEDYDPARKFPAALAPFGPSSLDKRLNNKLALQKMLGFVPDERIPLVGMVSRLIPINGFQFLQALQDKLKELGELQLAVLAEGGLSDSREMLLRWEGKQDANRPWIKSRFNRDAALARHIYAGCDIFLIPAMELPSGISQFIAMRFGAVPLVYHTGALCDSVVEYQDGLKLQSGLSLGIGFKFYEYSDEAFLKSMKDALAVYRSNDPAVWRNIQLHNMRQHFNWAQPATDYLELYQRVLREESTLIPTGTPLRLNREADLLQAILEVDNLPGLGAHDAREILKQAGRIIRGVLRCDAVYVWDTEYNLGGEILEVSLDRGHSRIEPGHEDVARLLNRGAADVWGPLGDTDGSGICRPIVGLAESELAQKLGWQTGRSVSVTAHGRLLGRIDALQTKTPAHEESEWQTMALTALASAFGQRLHTVREAKELDDVSKLASQLLEAGSFDESVKIVLGQIRELMPATKAWLYHQRGTNLIHVGNAEEAEIGLVPAKQVVQSGKKMSVVDWIDAPRGGDGRRLYRSLLALPLSALNRQSAGPIGALVLAHGDAGAFAQDQEQFLERRLAPQAAAALATTGWYLERDRTRVNQLKQLSESLVSGGDFENLLSKIVTTTMEVLKAQGASLYLLNQETRKLVIRAAAGYHEPLMRAQERPLYDIGEGLTGWMAEREEPFRANSKDDLHNERWKGKFKALQGDREPNAYLGIPLKVEGRIVGVLKLEDRIQGLGQDTFSDEDELLARMMGNIIATVVYNAQISRQVSEQKLSDFSKSLRQLSSVLVGAQGREILMKNIVEKIREVVEVDAASLFLVDESGQRLVIRAASGYQEKLISAEPRPSYAWGEGVTGRIAKDNTPFQADSLAQLRTKGGGTRGKFDPFQDNKQPESFYGIPLNVEGETKAIGVLKVEGLKPRAWTDEDRLLIQMMGNIIAAVVYNAEISERKLTKLSDGLRDLSRVLVGGRGRETLMRNIVEKIKDVVEVDAASLFLVDESGQRLVIRAASGYQEKLISAEPRPSYAWGEGVTGRIARDNTPFQADSLVQLRTKGGGTRGKFDPFQDNKQPESFYGIPLNVEGEANAIGVLKVEGLKPRAWTDEDRLLIQMMGNIIAAVVYNAENSERKLDAFSDNIRSLSNVLTPGGQQTQQQWFQRIVDTLSRMLVTDAASLYLVDETNKRLVISAASGYQEPLMKAKAFYEWGEGVTGRIAAAGEPFAADSLEKLRERGVSKRGKYDDLQGGTQPNSFYGVPLIVTGRATPIGVLKFESLQENFFSDETHLLISMMANVIATAIHNTQEGEKRIREILRRLGTLSQPVNSSAQILEEYAKELDGGLVNQLAFGLAEDLGTFPGWIEAEAETIFEARKHISPEARAELYERISNWGMSMHHERVEWEFALYAAIVRSNRRFEHWDQVRNVAAPWLRLKENVSAPYEFGTVANNLAAEIARFIEAKPSSGQMDPNANWFKIVLDTESIFGEQVKHILLLFQCQGVLDESNQVLLEQMSTADAEHPYPVLLIVLWNTGATSQQIQDLRDHLKSRKVDVVFARTADLLRIMESAGPTDRFRSLVLRQTTIVSPFVTDGRVPDALFFGRDGEIKTLTLNPTGSDWAILGNRKIGKTSLWYKVHSILGSNRSVLPIRMDCQAVRTLDDFFRRFQDSTGIELADRTPMGFEQALVRLKQKGPTPVILLDEVDRLLKLDDRKGEALVQTWRWLAQERACRFVFFGGPFLARQRVNPKSDLFNFAAPLPLGYLSEDDARLVLARPLEMLDVELENVAAITDQVLSLTSGHPNLIQEIGKRLVDAANQRRERFIRRDDVTKIANSSDFRDLYLAIIWGDSTPLEQLITLIAPDLQFRLADVEEALTVNGVVLMDQMPGSPPERKRSRTRVARISHAMLQDALGVLKLFSTLREEERVYHFVPRSFLEILHRLPKEVIQRMIRKAIADIREGGLP